MADDVDVRVDGLELERLLRSDAMHDMLEDFGDQVADNARALAPKRTGRGAASIHTEMVFDGAWEAHVSWEAVRYWMLFQEKGTVKMSAHPFLELGLEAAAEG